MSLESLSIRHGVDCELGEVLFSYYLKEHDIDKGRFKIITRVGRVPLISASGPTMELGKIDLSLSEEI